MRSVGGHERKRCSVREEPAPDAHASAHNRALEQTAAARHVRAAAQPHHACGVKGTLGIASRDHDCNVDPLLHNSIDVRFPLSTAELFPSIFKIFSLKKKSCRLASMQQLCSARPTAAFRYASRRTNRVAVCFVLAARLFCASSASDPARAALERNFASGKTAMSTGELNVLGKPLQARAPHSSGLVTDTLGAGVLHNTWPRDRLQPRRILRVGPARRGASRRVCRRQQRLSAVFRLLRQRLNHASARIFLPWAGGGKQVVPLRQSLGRSSGGGRGSACAALCLLSVGAQVREDGGPAGARCGGGHTSLKRFVDRNASTRPRPEQTLHIL